MAERKLNFNAPILSTRRIQKTAVSMRRNKSNNFTDDSKTDDCSSVLVLVPEMGLDQVTEPASVPFTWEQAPGKSKDIDFTPCDFTEEVFTPCLPPGKAIDGNLIRFQSLKGKQVEESEGEDDVFSDARDTLSPMDSFSVNNSISGVSGYGFVETKKPSNLSEDRDFMLNRFLPAAKAMTIEQSHYALNRKPLSFMSEPTMQIRGLVPEEKKQTPDRFVESIDDEDSEEEDEDDEVSEYAYLSKKGCGILQQLCFKDSLSMLNTVPGLKAKPNSPRSSSNDQVKTSKVAQLKSRFESAKKVQVLDSCS